MKRFEDVEEKVVTRIVCVELVCDMCGKEAENPDSGSWRWAVVGYAGGELHWFSCVGDDYDPNGRHLCYDCAEWIGEHLKNIQALRKASE